jgi:hypothetical protein
VSIHGPDRNLIFRLLGPAEPEVSCERCFELLDRYVDLELAGEDADARLPGMRAHLEGCPACHEDHESLRELVAATADWRRRILRRAGFRNELARELAGDGDIDLHDVLELVDRGCPPELAARILAPL